MAQVAPAARWTPSPAAAAAGDAPVPARARSHRLLGAAAGFVVGAGATWIVIHAGGSTSLCDRSRNQDALAPRECLGLVVLGGAVGAGVGALIGGAIHSAPLRAAPPGRLRLQAVPGRRPRIAVRMRL